MNSRIGLPTFLLIVLSATVLMAQARPPSMIGVQGPSATVQLPTFSFFAISTTVLVPDSGAGYLGGINSSSTGRMSRGFPLMPGGVAPIGANRGAAGMSVRAWVHDFQEMDEAVLAEAAARRAGAAASGAAEPARHVQRGDRAPLESIASIRAQQQREDSEANAEVLGHIHKADSLLAAGKPGVARIYYQMALRRAHGPLKESIAAQLRALNGPTVAGRR